MSQCLLSGETHHELLVFEGLMALTNIASTQQAQSTNLGISKPLMNLSIGKRRGKDVSEDRTLYNVVMRELLFEKNQRIQLASCELLANLSLTPEFHNLVS